MNLPRHEEIMEIMGTDPDAVAERLVVAEDALRRIARIPNKPDGGDWDEIEEARGIAESFLLSNAKAQVTGALATVP